jgi:hypothetical protein
MVLAPIDDNGARSHAEKAPVSSCTSNEIFPQSPMKVFDPHKWLEHVWSENEDIINDGLGLLEGIFPQTAIYDAGTVPFPCEIVKDGMKEDLFPESAIPLYDEDKSDSYTAMIDGRLSSSIDAFPDAYPLPGTAPLPDIILNDSLQGRFFPQTARYDAGVLSRTQPQSRNAPETAARTNTKKKRFIIDIQTHAADIEEAKDTTKSTCAKSQPPVALVSLNGPPSGVIEELSTHRTNHTRTQIANSKPKSTLKANQKHPRTDSSSPETKKSPHATSMDGYLSADSDEAYAHYRARRHMFVPADFDQTYASHNRSGSAFEAPFSSFIAPSNSSSPDFRSVRLTTVPQCVVPPPFKHGVHPRNQTLSTEELSARNIYPHTFFSRRGRKREK